jgi:integrase/recombinase XerD
MDWQQALETFCQDSLTLSSSTLINIRIDIRDFFNFCPKELGAVNPQDFVEWRNFLKGKYKYSYVQRKLEWLALFFEYLCEEGFMVNNPAVGIRIPQEDMSARETITKDEYQQLMSASQHDLSDQIMIAILYTGGLRLNELVKLKTNGIDWRRGVLLVYDDKIEKQRLAPITYDCLTRLKMYLQNRESDSIYIFPSSVKKGYPITTTTVNKVLYGYKDKLGIEKQLSPLIFRYTYASNLHAAGFDISEIAQFMGHVKISVTRRYIQCFESSRDENYKKYYR